MSVPSSWQFGNKVAQPGLSTPLTSSCSRWHFTSACALLLNPPSLADAGCSPPCIGLMVAHLHIHLPLIHNPKSHIPQRFLLSQPPLFLTVVHLWHKSTDWRPVQLLNCRTVSQPLLNSLLPLDQCSQRQFRPSRFLSLVLILPLVSDFGRDPFGLPPGLSSPSEPLRQLHQIPLSSLFVS